MKNLHDVKKNDVLKRVMKSSDKQVWAWDAIVEEVTENEIICRVMVDVPRKMVFSRRTGVNVQGDGFGWLEFKEQ